MIPTVHFTPILPLIWVGAGAILVPLLEVLLARMIRNRRTFLGRTINREMASAGIVAFTSVVLLIALTSTIGAFGMVDGEIAFNPAHPVVAMDGLAHFLNGILLVSALLTVWVSSKYLSVLDINHGEFYALLLASLLGMMVLGAARDLVVLFLALELMSIPIYALAGFRRNSLRSNESALKYFIIGSFASGILLYGCALLYGTTGSVDLIAIAQGFDPENPVAMLGAAFVLVGFAFKVSSVPFHQWAPDVYEGAPTTVTGFMATAVKVAAFGALIRVLAVSLQPGADLIYGVLWWLAVLSMTVGNVMALIQQDAKRMLAYSSIAHAGYVLVGVAVATQSGYAAVLFYLLVYTFMTIGAFAVLAALAKDGREVTRIDDLAGLHLTNPGAALVMALCMFSLAGIPPLAGFWGKWYLLTSAIERATTTGDGTLVALAVILVLNSAVSLGYYLRVPIAMYMRDSTGTDRPDSDASSLQAIAIFFCAAAILILGLLPADVLLGFANEPYDLVQAARVAAATLRP